jgi:hypothetical protein
VGANAFTVEPAALRHLAGQLAGLADQLGQVRSATQRIDASEFGSSELSSAAGHFVEHWSWQADRLGETLRTTGERLTTAADQYDAVETAQLHAQGGTGG